MFLGLLFATVLVPDERCGPWKLSCNSRTEHNFKFRVEQGSFTQHFSTTRAEL
jgi:hypothetical protein